MMQIVPSSDPTENNKRGSACSNSANGLYGDNNDNDNEGVGNDNAVENAALLGVWQGIALLTADCMGVGVLGLPNDIKTLGYAAGFVFLLGNLPINYYAGNLLSDLALDLERQHGTPHEPIDNGQGDDDNDESGIELKAPDINSFSNSLAPIVDDVTLSSSKKQNQADPIPRITDSEQSPTIHRRRMHEDKKSNSIETQQEDDEVFDEDSGAKQEAFRDEILDEEHTHRQSSKHDLASNQQRWGEYPAGSSAVLTKDLINITEAMFYPSSSIATAMVKTLYYTNLFLVLGDYILVMARSVSAIFADQVCLPTASAIASVLMFGLCQFRTMANLGRSVSLASLLALLVVLLQCLFHHRLGSSNQQKKDVNVMEDDEVDDGIWGMFSSLAGIGFAVGSQKLLLNIRFELKHRERASTVLAGSLSVYGLAYVVVILLAGPDPPSFLFDSISDGWSRRFAGLLLWFHVSVSYAINSQALCASLDQVMVLQSFSSTSPFWSKTYPATRWFFLTLAVSISSYIVSNAIPFFKALVGLIGALTSVPLSLTLPAILHRRANQISLLWPDVSHTSTQSYLLFLYSLAFLGIGLVGAISSIDEDWINHGKPFSCT